MPNNDLISRSAAKEAIRKKFSSISDRCEINEVINGLPAVDAIPVEWLRQQYHDNPASAWGNKCKFMYMEWRDWQKEQEAR